MWLEGFSLGLTVGFIAGMFIGALYDLKRKTQVEDPPPAEPEVISPQPLPNLKNRTMWDLPDPFMKKDK